MALTMVIGLGLGCRSIGISDSCTVDSDCWAPRWCSAGHCREPVASPQSHDAASLDGSTTDGGAAPPGMVFLSFPGGDFWIDVYEASLVPGVGELGSASLDADGDGKVADRTTATAHRLSHNMHFDEDPARAGELDPAEAGVKLTTVVARSVPLSEPRINITFWQAAAACANAGKRLCNTSEWRWACSGAGANNTFAYGNTFDGADEKGRDCWTSGLGGLAPTGSASGCVTPQGLYDMSGNAEEMTDLAGKNLVSLRGGWVSGPGAASTCSSTVEIAATTPSGEAGFRCCRDP